MARRKPVRRTWLEPGAKTENFATVTCWMQTDRAPRKTSSQTVGKGRLALTGD